MNMRQSERSRVFAVAMMAAVAALTVAGALVAQAIKVDAAVPSYQATSGVSGSLKSIGSDSMNNEMTLWGEAFRKLYPNVKIEIEGKGSGTAPPALTAGTSQFGPMSRPMKDAENDAFEKQFGYKPTQIRTSLDALAVYVNKDNPLECLTLQKVDAIFSKGRRGGWSKDIKTWGDLGLTGEWAAKPISLYGRNSASGTYGYFKEHALFNGDYKDTVKEQPGSSSVVQGVASDRYAIGYSGIGYKTADVRAVPIAAKDGDECHPADVENVYSGKYPLWRYLLLYVNRKPGEALDPLREQFLTFVLSREGQEIVVKDGYLPLPKKIVDEELAKLK
jgi:phosphate transport system substrate-binding protein